MEGLATLLQSSSSRFGCVYPIKSRNTGYLCSPTKTTLSSPNNYKITTVRLVRNHKQESTASDAEAEKSSFPRAMRKLRLEPELPLVQFTYVHHGERETRDFVTGDDAWPQLVKFEKSCRSGRLTDPYWGCSEFMDNGDTSMD